MIKILFIVALSFTPAAHAYIDPGSGSFMLQMFLATLIGAGVTIKMFFNNIKEKFYSFFCSTKNDEKKGTEEITEKSSKS